MKNKELPIYLPHVEASALVWQAMSMGTRMELLDLLDYAKQNNSDTVSVLHLQEELEGLTKLDEKEFNSREKSYFRAHQTNSYIPCKEELPKEGKPVLVYHRSTETGDTSFVAMLTRKWVTKDQLDDHEPEEVFTSQSGMKIYGIEGNDFAMDEEGDYYEVNEDGKPFFFWMDPNRDNFAVFDQVDMDNDYWQFVPLLTNP